MSKQMHLHVRFGMGARLGWKVNEMLLKTWRFDHALISL